MSRENRSLEWLKDFESFLRIEEVAAPPRAVSESIRAAVKADLEPSLKLVAAKLFGLHVIAIGLVVLVCPQLGVGPLLIGGHGVMHVFMAFGRLPCAALCGGLLLGISSLLVTLFLRREELRLADRYRFINVTLLASVSFAALMLAGGESDQLSYAFWILGALAAGWSTLRIGASVRLRAPQVVIR